MEDQFRAELTPAQYEHEILAEFGTEEAGVFNKDKVDQALKYECYLYNNLDSIQERYVKEEGLHPEKLLYDRFEKAPMNPFRCMGVDFDAYQAGSSLLVLDYNVKYNKFKVIKRLEVPKGEYTLDHAVNLIIEFNEIYNPSWIFCDRGYGDYQLERLHIYGEEHPHTGLKNKVVGYQFKQTLEVIDPVTKEVTKEPMKQFMVNQLCLSFERDRMILSPFDETLHKQLIDYHVERISQDGKPIYTSKDEHFVDALGLAHLAFVLKFPKLTQAIQIPEYSSRVTTSNVQLGARRLNADIRSIEGSIKNPWGDMKQIGKAPGERKGDYQKWVPVQMGSKSMTTGRSTKWGGRNSKFSGRSMW